MKAKSNGVYLNDKDKIEYGQSVEYGCSDKSLYINNNYNSYIKSLMGVEVEDPNIHTYNITCYGNEIKPKDWKLTCRNHCPVSTIPNGTMKQNLTQYQKTGLDMLNKNNVIQNKDTVTYTCDTGYTLFNNETKYDTINSTCTADNSNVNLNIPTGYQCRPDCPLSTIPDGNIKKIINGALTPYTTLPSTVIYGTELQQKCDDTHYLYDQTSDAPHTAESYTMKCNDKGQQMQPGNYECKKYCPVSMGNVDTTSDHGFIYPLTGGAISTNWTYNLKHGETAEFKCNTATHTLYDTANADKTKHQEYKKIVKTCASGEDITPSSESINASCKKQCFAKGMVGAKMIWGVETKNEFTNKPYIKPTNWTYNNGTNAVQSWDTDKIPTDMTKAIKYNDYVRYKCIDGYTLHTKQTDSSNKVTYTKHDKDYYDITCDSGDIVPNSVIQCTKDCDYKPSVTLPNVNLVYNTTGEKMLINNTVNISCDDSNTHQLFDKTTLISGLGGTSAPSIIATCNVDGSYSFTGNTNIQPGDIDGANIQCKKIYKLDEYHVIPSGDNALGSWSSP